MPIAEAMNWVGVEKEEVAAKVFSSAGIPSKAGISGGKLTAIQMEHTWVEAYVNYENYRGVDDGGGEKAWVPLDASFKQYEYKEPVDLKSAVPFDAEGLINQMISSSTVDPAAGSITGPDMGQVQTAIEDYQHRMETYLEDNYPDATVSDLFGKRALLKEELGLLPASLPLKTVTVDTEYAQVSDSRRAKLSLSMPGLSYEAPLAELASKSISLSYMAATTEDKAILSLYTGIDAVPAYLVKLRPMLRVDGTVVSIGTQPLAMAGEENFTMSFSQPGMSPKSVNNSLTTGSYYAVALNTGKVTKEALGNGTAKLEAATQKLKQLADGSVSEVEVNLDDVVGRMLHLSGAVYFAQLDATNKLAAAPAGVTYQRDVSEAMTGMGTTVASTFGTPTSMKVSSLFFDVDMDNYFVAPKDGDMEKTKAFAMVSGPASSYLEGITYPKLFGQQGDGISTMTLLRQANQEGVPVYSITADNIAAALPRLSVSAPIKADIQNAVNQGMTITIPERNLTMDGWQGVGYIVADPETGSAGYMISGGMSGGNWKAASLIGSYGLDLFLETALIFEASDAILGLGSSAILIAALAPFVIVLFTFASALKAINESRLSEASKTEYRRLLVLFTTLFLGAIWKLTPGSLTPSQYQFAYIATIWAVVFTYQLVFSLVWGTLIEAGVEVK